MEIFIFKKLFLLQYLVIFVLGILNWNGFKVEGLTTYSDFSTLLSAVKYSKIRLHHYDWRYIRVELPNGFSSLSMTLTTDWVSGKRDLFDLSNDTIPLVCIRYGGPPLAESAVKSESSTALFDGYVHNMSNMGQCTSFQESMRVNLTEEQVFSRILYLGFFNGVGPIRTQSKMINRGSTYTVDIELVILGCRSSFLGGPYCNNTINSLTCPQVGLYNHPRRLHENPLSGKKHWKTGDLYPLGKSPAQQLGRTEGSCLFNCSKSIDGKRNKGISDSNGRGQIEKKENLSESAEHELICSNSQGKECIKNGEWKFFALEVVDISSLLELMVEYENFNSSNDNAKQTEVEATIYVRYNSLPQKALYEYSLPVRQSSLSILFPKLGWWYVGAYFSNTSKQSGTQDQEKEKETLCFVLKWRIYACSLGKAGDGCRWEVNTLKRVKRVGENVHLESHYLPINQEESTKSDSFPIETFFNNSSTVEAGQDVWTFLLFEVPHGAAGGVMSIELRSNSIISFDIYARFGSLPTLHVWDYHANVTHSAESSINTTSKDANKQTKMHLIIIYPHEGIWCLGLRRSSGHNLNVDNQQVTMSVSLQGCPNHCSKHGTCQHKYEESGLTSFSFCYCDRTHGGFDCSKELISPKGKMWQSATLVVSNIAAILPALWSIHHKAYSEWILYTTSGISSALYHSCDSGSWCALSFHVLQFMDFWLSFMAVVATFIYMASMDDKTKVAVHTSTAIITALIAVNGPTRSINIILIVIIGTLGLLFGWIVEFCRSDQIAISHSFHHSTIRERWQTLRTEAKKLLQKLVKRFRWRFICMGFLALGASGLSWHFENVQTYWFWHSLWHKKRDWLIQALKHLPWQLCKFCILENTSTL
ncbi:hypothetical protein SUGI_0873920 [Cryptomeria japonica]|nr:hypothetical protein SUGI_0873920 [Cryptomeria japonica]